MRYRVRYRTPDNRSTQKRGFKRKIDAERWEVTLDTYADLFDDDLDAVGVTG